MPIETVPEHDIRYHLVAFDAKGRERPEEGGPYSRAVLREAATSEPTDVFLFSHGWNGDVPDARRQYGRWLAAMASCGDDIAAAAAMPGGFRPLLVGLHWPSKAWGDEQLGGASFLVEATGEGTDGDDAGDDARDDVQALVSDLAAQLHDTPATRQAIRTIVQSALVDAAPATLPSEVRKAYQVIDADTGTGQEGAGAAPGDDREPFDAEATYQACQQEEIVSFGEVSLGGILAPLRVLTFWQMKRRARDFGESGASTLLRSLQEAAPAARFHLMGHRVGGHRGPARPGRPAAGPHARAGAGRDVAVVVLLEHPGLFRPARVLPPDRGRRHGGRARCGHDVRPRPCGARVLPDRRQRARPGRIRGPRRPADLRRDRHLRHPRSRDRDRRRTDARGRRGVRAAATGRPQPSRGRGHRDQRGHHGCPQRHLSWRGRARGVAGGGGHLRRCRPRWRGFPTICGSLGSGSAHEVRTIRARLR